MLMQRTLLYELFIKGKHYFASSIFLISQIFLKDIVTNILNEYYGRLLSRIFFNKIYNQRVFSPFVYHLKVSAD